ncbi:MAG: type VII secretion integral membrane protein EccD [Actinomycetia bacterium]|nr:type VII secretion integral membrane protein EccD [Actinomycetes bacterium]
MPDTLCRLAIHATETIASPGRSAPTGVSGASVAEAISTVDLILPRDCPVATLIPSIVDVVLGGPAGRDGSLAGTRPRRWCLTLIGGEPLDSSMTLRESAVHDGELILLTRAPLPASPSRPGDASGVVAGVAHQKPSAALHGAVTAAAVAVTTVSAATLAWSGAEAGSATHLWSAAAVGTASAVGAVAIPRAAHRLSVALSLAAVLFAMVTGFLAGTHSFWAPAFLLATSAGFAVSILMLHMTDGNTAVLTAAAAVTGAIATVSMIGLAVRLPFGAAGAILTVLSLAALSASPKLAVAAAGLGPSRPETRGRRAAFAHTVLTGLVTGWSAAATLGVTAVAAVAIIAAPTSAPPGSGPTAVTAIFVADVGLLLLLRQRTHIDGHRRVGLGAAGICALTAAHIVAVGATPEHAPWLCAATIIASMAAVSWASRAKPPNPVVRQSLQMLEYLALAAVIPLAAWVTGVYGLVRDLSLP